MEIKKARIAAGFTQQQLAEKMNVDRTAVTKWEIGTAMPTADKIVKLARVLGCSVDQLLSVDDAAAANG